VCVSLSIAINLNCMANHAFSFIDFSDGGSVLAYEDTVQLGVVYAGRCFTCCFGGEGFFNTTMKGPGKIYMQSMNIYRYANAVTTTVVEERGGGDDSGD